MKEDKEFILKKYNNIDELILASYNVEDDCDFKLEDLKDIEIGGISTEGNEIKFTHEQQKEGIELQGYWGWVDQEKVIHYWIGKDIPLEELIHFFAHEIGHRTGEPKEDYMEEEMRAEDYGYVASLAYTFAKSVKENKNETSA